MKIIDIQAYGVSRRGNHVLVKVITDEHIYGVGEAYRVGPDEATVKIQYVTRGPVTADATMESS